MIRPEFVFRDPALPFFGALVRLLLGLLFSMMGVALSSVKKTAGTLNFVAWNVPNIASGFLAYLFIALLSYEYKTDDQIGCNKFMEIAKAFGYPTLFGFALALSRKFLYDRRLFDCYLTFLSLRTTF